MSLDREELEELVTAIHEGNGIGGDKSYEDVAKRFLDATWSAISHQTGRCGRFYQPDDTSPEARIYRLMTMAFQGRE